MNLGASCWVRTAAPQRRFGLKGPRAAELLKSLKLAVPERPNSWLPLRDSEREDSWNVIGRLGSTEFFMEEGGDAPGISALEQLTRAGAAGAYPVMREDCAIVLGGSRALDVLAQLCNVNFAAVQRREVVMTLMIGVAVLVLPQQTEDGLMYRIWCDPSFGSYLKSELEKTVNQ